MAALFRVVFCLLVIGSTAATAADRAIIVLDASGSMWGQIDGRPKLDIARESLRTVLQTISADRELGLIAYGHREKGSCADIELVVAPGAGTGAAITQAAGHMKFLGKTPLTAAVKQAAEALRSTEEKATVILITDGLETCQGDPCALGRELEQSGVDFTAHVVGFGLTAEEGRQVACLAENTGGRYIQASDAASLRDALAETVAAAPAPEPQPAPAPEPAAPEFNFTPSVVFAPGVALAADNPGNAWEIHRIDAAGGKGERVTTEYNSYKGNLEPGDYIVVARLDKASTEQKVTIRAGEVASPEFVLNAGTLVLRPRPSEGAEVDGSASTVIDHPGGTTTEYGAVGIVLPAGRQTLKVSIGKGSVSDSVELAAGQTVERDIVVGVGAVLMNAFYTAGGDRVEASGVAFRVARAARKIDGSREELLTTYGPDSRDFLPAGDYVLVGRMDHAEAEQPFAIKVGELSEVKVSLEAGVLAISAPGAESLEIVSAKKDIAGNRKSVGTFYAQEQQVTLSAGDYVVIARRSGGADKEISATVKPGERSEVAVP